MKKRFSLIALGAALFLFSCKDNGSTDGLPIPKDATMVVHVNTNSLTSKLSWDEIKGSTWFRENSQKEQDSLTRQIMENPESSGVDIKSDFVFFMQTNGKSTYTVLEGKLKDADAFENMVKKNKTDQTVQKNGDLEYLKADGDGIVTWTNNRFFIIMSNPMMMPGSRGNTYDENMNSGGSGASVNVDSLNQYAKSLLALKSDNSLEKDKRFADLVKEEGDVHFWLNYQQMTPALAQGNLAMFKVSDLLKDMAGTFTINFDKGRIAGRSKWYFGEQMNAIMEKYKSANISKDLINRIPFGNVSALMASNYDPRLWKELLTVAGYDGMVNGALGEMNLTLDEVISSIKGEFLFAIADFDLSSMGRMMVPMQTPNDGPYANKPGESKTNYIFAASINNKQAFDKILKLAEEKTGGEKPALINYKASNDWFVVSNSTSNLDQFLAGGNRNNPVADRLGGHPVVFYVDLQTIIKSGFRNLENAADSAQYNAVVSTWQDITGTGGDYSNRSTTYDFAINMVDKNTNSLKQLNQFGEKMVAARKLRWDYGVPGAMGDSTIAAPPVVEPKPE